MKIKMVHQDRSNDDEYQKCPHCGEWLSFSWIYRTADYEDYGDIACPHCRELIHFQTVYTLEFVISEA